MSRKFSGVTDWKLQHIYEGDIVESQQGTKFVVEYSEQYGWCLIQCNQGNCPDLQGDWFSLKEYMQPNLEVIGNIYTNPELCK